MSEMPYRQWGADIEEGALKQMENARALPVTAAAALMPDAHQGYGLPIGGVLATDNAVIPYAVGMDIACRMKLTVLDLPVSALTGQAEKLRNALLRETVFGVGSKMRRRCEHPVLDEDWTVSPVVLQNKNKAWDQLGTSGSGNHFVEFGVLTLERPARLWSDPGKAGRHGGELPAGEYLALLSHSGSRGTGGAIATHYSRLAATMHPELPPEQKRLAWFELDSREGREYWDSMLLMGKYSAACHELIHRAIAGNLKADVLADVENHHNFAWKETHFGRDVVVHRKGATPAPAGVLGVIPGTMGTPGYVVRGKGNAEALASAAHGAGRCMSRKAARQRFTKNDMKAFLAGRGVTLLSAGVDECPLAYKDIDEVMRQQRDLVEVVARFVPRIVRMCGTGERGED
ncbi:MAG: RtcB family protein [Planctomycetota bacterium]|jgi:tRNA-splicing ligase RtcB|nr:RtcB family protein [Planctomycetota bacterium]